LSLLAIKYIEYWLPLAIIIGVDLFVGLGGITQSRSIFFLILLLFGLLYLLAAIVHFIIVERFCSAIFFDFLSKISLAHYW